MKEAAMEQALKALEGFIPYLPIEHDKQQCDRYDKAITALRQALANEALDRMAENARELGLDYEPADEPVAWMYPSDYEKCLTSEYVAEVTSIECTSVKTGEKTSIALYTRPQPAAQWVGLTDEDIALFDWESFKTKKDCSRAIEQALKEKNT